MTSEYEEYVAGFFDGDGSISMVKPSKDSPRGRIAVSFSQSCESGVPPELQHLAGHFKGHLWKRKPNPKHRQGWVLNITNREDVLAFASAIVDKVAIKTDQLRTAVDFMLGVRDDFEAVYLELKASKSSYNEVVIDPRKLTDAYIAGVFEADGSLGMYKAKGGGFEARLRITQWGCVDILHKILSKVVVGHVNKQGYLEVAESQVLPILGKIAPHLRGQKKAQVDLVYAYLRDNPSHRGKRREDGEVEEKAAIAKRLKELKKT